VLAGHLHDIFVIVIAIVTTFLFFLLQFIYCLLHLCLINIIFILFSFYGLLFSFSSLFRCCVSFSLLCLQLLPTEGSLVLLSQLDCSDDLLLDQ
jgi:hypothetical protein